MKNKHPLSRKTNLVVQEVNGEVLIYDLSKNKAFCLNETSTLVWHLCDGNKSITNISLELGKKLKTPVDEGLVWLALEQLKKEELIENEVIPPTAYQGMSRREVIKKVGLASMITLPVMATLIAPTALHAQSGCPQPIGLTPIGSACTTSCQCANSNTMANFMCCGPTPAFPAPAGGCRNDTPGTGCFNP